MNMKNCQKKFTKNHENRQKITSFKNLAGRFWKGIDYKTEKDYPFAAASVWGWAIVRIVDEKSAKKVTNFQKFSEFYRINNLSAKIEFFYWSKF